jgi:hypothetical protein
MYHLDVILQILTLIVVLGYTIVTYRLFRQQTRQGFENKFFQLLRFHHDIVNAVETPRVGPTLASATTPSGRPAFHSLYNSFVAHYDAEHNKNPQVAMDRLANEAYSSFFKLHQDSLGHYFRNLYHLIKFVDKSNVIDAKEKQFYTHLVRAQMSSDELLLLFYNCWWSIGKEKFYPLVVKCALLKNMSQNDLVSRRLKHPADHKSLYPSRAYGEP